MSIYFDLQNNPIITTSSSLTVPKITGIAYPGDDTAADTAGGQTITITGSGFNSGASVIINGSAVGVVTVLSSTLITFVSPAQSTGSYPLYVINTDGGTGVAVPGIQYSGTPVWSTAAGSLGSYVESQSIANTVTATGDAPVTYSLYSGTLPTGATLNTSNGYISGTSPAVGGATTYTFTIRATDAQLQDTNRSFSLTINPDAVTWSSPANNTTYTYYTSSAISNVTLSASASSGQGIVYTANALPTGLSLSGSNISGTPTVGGNSSTLLTATANVTGKSATDTINWVIYAGDTYFKYVSLLLSASNSPSATFVSDISTNNFALTVSGNTRPNNLNPYTPGYYSNYFDGTGDYLATPSSASFNLSGNLTVECWFYIDPSSGSGLTGLVTSFNPSNGGSFFMGFNSSFAMNVRTGNDASVVNGTTTIKTGAWYHMAVVKDGSSSMKGYLNGTLECSSASFNWTGQSQPCYVGSYASAAGPFKGYISNARVVNGTAVYTGNFTPSTTPLTAITNTVLLTSQSNRFLDNSTNNFTITVNGDTKISGFIPFAPNSSYSTYGSGYFGGTSSDYITSTYNAAFTASGDFTVEAWVYLTTTSAVCVSSSSNTSGQSQWALYVNSTAGKASFYWVNTSPTGVSAVGATTIQTYTWTHLAGTKSGNTLRIFVNGVLDGSNTTSGSVRSQSSPTFTIGSEGNGAFTPVTGYISDLRIVNGTAVYTATFTPPSSPLTAIANTSLLTLQKNQPNNNNMFVDNSTNNLLITRTGNSTQGSFSPYGGGWSNYFDGSGDYLSLASTSTLAFGTGDFCVEMWYYQLSNALAGLFSNSTSSGGGDAQFEIQIAATTFYPSLYGWATAFLTSNTASTANQWNHLAVCRSGTTASMFLNGTRVATATVSNNFSSTNAFNIGRQASGSAYITGYISNLRAVKGSSVYNPSSASISIPTTPLQPIANTQLLTCQSPNFVDNSFNNFTITKNGDTSVQRFSPYSGTTLPTPYYGAYFDGSGDYLSIASNAAFGVGTGDFTIEAWLYPVSWPSAGNYSCIFQVDGTGIYFGLNSAGFGLRQSATANIISYNTNPTVNTWTHVTVVRSGTTCTLYYNGTSVATATSSANFSAGNSWIGADATPGNYFTGYISNLRLVKGVAVYTGNFTTPTSPLSATQSSGTNISAITGTQTSLLTCQSATFIDNSTNNFTITANGDSKPTYYNPFTVTYSSLQAYSSSVNGGSMYFDGTGDYVTVASVPNLASTQNWSVCAWVYPTYLTPSNYNRFFSGTDFNMGQYSGTWYLTNNSIGLISAGSVVANAWTHVAVINKASTGCYIYINGVLGGSGGAGSFTMGSSRIGADSSGSTNWYGYVSDLQIITNASAPLYSSNFVPPSAPVTPIQNTTLLVNGTGAGIYDSAMLTELESVGDSRITTSLVKYGNSSMYFDGTGDYLSTSLNMPYYSPGTADFTIEFWAYTDTNNKGIMSCFTQGSYNGWAVNIVSGGFIWYAGNGSGVEYQLAYKTANFTGNTWNFVTCVKSGTTCTIYLNGVAATPFGISQITQGSTLYIGAGSFLSSNQFQAPSAYSGYLCDVRITKGVARYSSNFSVPTTPFISY